MSSYASFMSLVPPGWLHKYCAMMVRNKNEMPVPFHFLAGASVIGQLLGLDCWATLNKGVRVYPNINVLLLSPAGGCRRGEGTKIIEKVARLAGMNVLSGKTTPEGLLDEIEDNGDVFLYVEELAMLLTKQDFQRPIIPVLTKLLLHGDGPCDLRSRTMGRRHTLSRINLSALFTSAPDWFMSTIPEEAYGGGMMSRFIVCCLPERDVYHIDIQADDAHAVTELAQLSGELAQLKGTLTGHFVGTDTAQKWIAKWYNENERVVIEDERLAPHRNRKPANLLRMAMILAAASGQQELTKELLENALAILDWIEPTLRHLYGMTDIVVNELSKGEKRVVDVLSKNGTEAIHSDLVRGCSSYFKEGVGGLRKCLDGLIEKDLIEPIYKQGVKTPWPPRGWRLRLPLAPTTGSTSTPN